MSHCHLDSILLLAVRRAIFITIMTSLSSINCVSLRFMLTRLISQTEFVLDLLISAANLHA